MTGTTWPEFVGYRHEVLHAGVLRHLLNDSARGAAVASALTDAEVVGVRRAAVERRVPGFEAVADLVAQLELAGGETLSLGGGDEGRQQRNASAAADRGAYSATHRNGRRDKASGPADPEATEIRVLARRPGRRA